MLLKKRDLGVCHLAAHPGVDNCGAAQSEIKETSMNSQPMDENHKPCPVLLCCPLIATWKKIISNSKTEKENPVYNPVYSGIYWQQIQKCKVPFSSCPQVQKNISATTKLFLLRMDLRAQVIVTHSQWDEQLNSDPRGTTTKRNICYIWDSGSKRVSDFLYKENAFQLSLPGIVFFLPNIKAVYKTRPITTSQCSPETEDPGSSSIPG